MNGLFLRGLVQLYQLKAACQRRVLFKVLFVFRPGRGGDGAKFATRQCRLEQVGGVAAARRVTGADERMRFVDEQDDALRGSLDLIDDALEALLEFSLDRSARLQRAQVQSPKRNVA
ncbi:hypothetical protein D3C87_1791150 [compost metagenome]